MDNTKPFMHGKAWTSDDDALLQLRWLAGDQPCVKALEGEFGRSNSSIVARLVHVGLFPDRDAVRVVDRTRQTTSVEISREVWRRAPQCPREITDPLAFGIELHRRLKAWAEEYDIAPESLVLWTAGSEQPQPSNYQRDPLWQITWRRGPSKWSIFLLHGASYDADELDVVFNGRLCFLEPSEDQVLGMMQLPASS